MLRSWISVFLLAAGLLGVTLAAGATMVSNEPSFEDCPVSVPPQILFVPPEQFPSQPPGTHFWYGSEALWTALPADSTWSQLPRDEHGYGNKLPWWSVDFDVEKDPFPDLVVRARRLDGPARVFQHDQATNGFSPESGLFMLTWVSMDTAGCWEITGMYRQASLTFVIWIAP